MITRSCISRTAEIKNIIIVDDYLSPWAVRKAHERGEVNAVVDARHFPS